MRLLSGEPDTGRAWLSAANLPLDVIPQIRLFLKLTKRARAGNRAGLFRVRAVAVLSLAFAFAYTSIRYLIVRSCRRPASAETIGARRSTMGHLGLRYCR
jgi:hypothetical protein